MGSQLAFDLDPAENFSRDDFIRGAGNAAALDLVESWPNWPARAVAIVGPEGSGKSHLAAIWAAAAGRAPPREPRARRIRRAGGARDRRAGARMRRRASDGSRRPRRARPVPSPQSREGAAGRSCFSPPAWRLRPGRSALPDLASRLRAVPVVTLAAPDDAMLRAVLVKLFADRQIAVDEALISYLMVRIERSFAAARVDRRDARPRGAAPPAPRHPGAGR